MVDDVATGNSQPLAGQRRLRSRPTPYNLQSMAAIAPQLRRKTDWNRHTMDPLLQNDTRQTRINLDEGDTERFLEFFYPDRLLLPTRKIGPGNKGDSTMEGILKIFRENEWYSSTSRKGKGRAGENPGGWLEASGCPSLDPKSIRGREVGLAKFLNKVLHVVGNVCNRRFLRWDAKSANFPLDGSYASRKPDIVCYFDASDARRPHWERVATFCEVKNRNDTPKQEQSFTEIAGKVSCIQVTQSGRYRFPCIRILGSCVFLTIFDSGGSITSHAVDIHKSPIDFLRIIMGVSLFDRSTLGFDISINWDNEENISTDEEGFEQHDEMAESDDEENMSAGEEGFEPDDEITQSDDEEPGPSDEQPPTINKWLEVVDREGHTCKISLESLLSTSDSLIGRKSTVWKGVINSDTPGAENIVVIKDSWIDPLRTYTEGMILHILEQKDVKGVPTLLAEQQVKIRHHTGFATETVNLSTHFIRSMLQNISSPHSFHLRVLSRLVTRPIGTSITNFSSLAELLVAFMDCIIAHKDAVDVARVLHRDISLTNLLLTMTNGTNQTTHEKYIQNHIFGQARVDLCNRISHLTRRGLLADWDYAILLTSTADDPSMQSSEGDPPMSSTKTTPLASQLPVRQIDCDEMMMIPASRLTGNHDIVLPMGTDDPKRDLHHANDSHPLYRTGMWRWMAAELVMTNTRRPQVMHSPLHDLESFFYVLVGICIFYSKPLEPKSEEALKESYDRFFNTFEPSVLKTITIQADLTWFPHVVDHISPYFRPIIPLLINLRNTIIQPMSFDAEGKFHRKTLFDHDTIIQHFVMALSSLGPESWALDENQAESPVDQHDPSLSPLCDSLKVPGQRSGMRSARGRPHDGDSDEYHDVHSKRARLSVQGPGPSQSGPSPSPVLPNVRVQDDMPPGPRHSRRKELVLPQFPRDPGPASGQRHKLVRPSIQGPSQPEAGPSTFSESVRPGPRRSSRLKKSTRNV